jgi:mRNA interferase MazF
MAKGEVWLVNLDLTIADEIRKVRPAVIMNRDAIGILALRVVVPITGWQSQFQNCDWLIRVDPDKANGLDKPSAADTFQVRSISSRRFIRQLGRLTGTDMERIATGLKIVFDF